MEELFGDRLQRYEAAAATAVDAEWEHEAELADVELQRQERNQRQHQDRTGGADGDGVLACRAALQSDDPHSPQVDSSRPQVIGQARWRAMVAQARHFFEHRSGLPSAHPLSSQVDCLATWNTQDLRTLLDHGSAC